MKTLLDVTCRRCGWTSSLMWVELYTGRHLAHVCVDGNAADDSLTSSVRVVPGPGERGRDDELKDP